MIYYYLISPCFCSITSFYHVNDDGAAGFCVSYPLHGPILTPQATRRSPDDESVDNKTFKNRLRP